MCSNVDPREASSNHMFKKELLFKYVVIGDFGVGKTSIIKRYAEDTFSSAYKITIGTDFAIKTINWDENTLINLQLWDIAGHERFGSLTSVYYRHALAAAVVFDLTRPETFKSTEKWITDLRGKISLPNGKPIPVILLANKGDITTDNVPENIDEYCKRNNIFRWLITSAKENINLDDAMTTLLQTTLNSYDSNRQVEERPLVLREPEKKLRIRKFCFF